MAPAFLPEIKLVIYDFDGVMTDNRVVVDQDGRESVTVNRADGLAVGLIRQMGIEQMILSTERNAVVQRRAEKLGIPCLNNLKDKKKALEEHLRRSGINRENVAYIGNDINDQAVMEFVGFPVAPADAAPAVKRTARIVTRARGGEGVVREFLDILCRIREEPGCLP